MADDDVKFNTRKQKSFDYTSEAAKQLITVATAITIFTVAFNKDIAGTQPGSMPETNKWLLITAWVYYLISILSGFFTILGLAGQLDPGDDDPSLSSNPSIWEYPVIAFLQSQQISFVFGLTYTAAFGIATLYYPLFPLAAVLFIAIPPVWFIGKIVSKLKPPKEISKTFYAHVEDKRIVPDSEFPLEPSMKFHITVLPPQIEQESVKGDEIK